MKEPRVLKIHKAMNLEREEEVQPLVIEAIEPHPYDKKTSLSDMQVRWQQEGQELSDALFDHLPGGLIDGLLAAMLKRRASLFVVKF